MTVTPTAIVHLLTLTQLLWYSSPRTTPISPHTLSWYQHPLYESDSAADGTPYTENGETSTRLRDSAQT
eukprot:3935173-Rhodomonas_salina.1